jgi:hypothetical protein
MDHVCRHSVPAVGGDYEEPDWKDLIGFVGWDRALNTMFFQMGFPDPDDPTEIDPERMVKWVGTRWKEIPTVDQLGAFLWNGAEGDKHIGPPWAQLSRELGEHLEATQARYPANSRTSPWVEGMTL